MISKNQSSNFVLACGTREMLIREKLNLQLDFHNPQNYIFHFCELDELWLWNNNTF